MRIFVGYGYNPRDAWIEDKVFPLVEAFGSEVVHGKVLAGQELPNSIKYLIDSSDGLIRFATQREKLKDREEWITHPWVRDELIYALDREKNVLEVREQGVAELSGLAGRDRQYVPYEEAKRGECLIGVVETLGAWHRRTTERFQLLPDEAVRPYIDKPCTYWIKDFAGAQPLGGSAEIEEIEGGLFLKMPNLSRGSLVRVEIHTKRGILSCAYTSVHKFVLRLNWQS
jgi:hypothetical protein